MAIKNFVEELEWRGMIHSIMPGTQEQLQKEMSTAYVGIDPIGRCPHIWKCLRIITLTKCPMCSESAVGSLWWAARRA